MSGCYFCWFVTTPQKCDGDDNGGDGRRPRMIVTLSDLKSVSLKNTNLSISRRRHSMYHRP